ncbi:MAG: quinolinate synthase NadA, partial [Chlorobi bacterium]|nr:quinolinate synthase NadA [Chlorobiota bacterium]
HPAFIKKNKGYKVITYVNTTAAVKAFTDITCTSTNALQIIQSLPEKEKIIFAPDKNLGNYIMRKTGRDMIVWDWACHVHEEFSVERILEIKKIHPEAKIIAHPECKKPVQIIADFIGSTSALLKYTERGNDMEYIVATEPGILYKMKKMNPEKTFIPAPPKDSTCACSECEFMKMITLEKIYKALKNESPEIKLSKNIIEKAKKPILEMLEISDKLKL